MIHVGKNLLANAAEELYQDTYALNMVVWELKKRRNTLAK
jgi:hypothetical protein